MDLFDILTVAEILVGTTFLGTPTLTVLRQQVSNHPMGDVGNGHYNFFFNLLLINPDNPQIDFFYNSKLMRMQEAFSDIPCIETSSYTLYRNNRNITIQSQYYNSITI
jgi:hypothetical protein